MGVSDCCSCPRNRSEILRLYLGTGSSLIKARFLSHPDGEYNDLDVAVKLSSLDCELARQVLYEKLTFDESTTTPNLPNLRPSE